MSIMPETDRTDKIDRADEFLDKYRQLEEALRNKYGGDEKNYGSPIVRFLSEKESKPYRDRLNVCREIRNFLTHHTEFDGERVIQPSNSLIRFLDEVTAFVKSPPSALNFATLYEDILKTSLSQKAQTVMKKMQRQGFSHVPIIENNKLYGVLSSYAAFEFVTEQGMQILSDETKVKDMKSYLPIDRHRNEYYRFMPKTTTFIEADEAFEKRDEKRRRLVSIFITDHGRNDEPIRAMLTPWSVVGK